jgi:hypothetical protein
MELLESHILELEKELLKTETRRSAEKISELISDDFIEFCSSGYVYHYSKNDVFYMGSNESLTEWEISEFSIKQLASDIVLTTYRLAKQDEVDEKRKYSLRSSIWKDINGTWKMIFHQGTPS